MNCLLQQYYSRNPAIIYSAGYISRTSFAIYCIYQSVYPLICSQVQAAFSFPSAIRFLYFFRLFAFSHLSKWNRFCWSHGGGVAVPPAPPFFRSTPLLLPPLTGPSSFFFNWTHSTPFVSSLGQKMEHARGADC